MIPLTPKEYSKLTMFFEYDGIMMEEIARFAYFCFAKSYGISIGAHGLNDVKEKDF